MKKIFLFVSLFLYSEKGISWHDAISNTIYQYASEWAYTYHSKNIYNKMQLAELIVKISSEFCSKNMLNLEEQQSPTQYSIIHEEHNKNPLILQMLAHIHSFKNKKIDYEKDHIAFLSLLDQAYFMIKSSIPSYDTWAKNNAPLWFAKNHQIGTAMLSGGNLEANYQLPSPHDLEMLRLYAICLSAHRGMKKLKISKKKPWGNFSDIDHFYNFLNGANAEPTSADISEEEENDDNDDE